MIVSLAIGLGIDFFGVKSIEAVLIVALGALVISSCFATLHIDMAQSIHIFYLLDQESIA